MDVPGGRCCEGAAMIRCRTARILKAAALPALPAGLCLLALITVYSADDFFYCTFFDGGLAGWFGQMAEHYRSFNGRMLVHTAATVILRAGNWLFAGTVLLCCLTMWYCGGRFLGQEKPEWSSFLLFFAGVLLMPRPMMVEGVLWISACCNYLLPTAMIFCQLCLVKKVMAGGARGRTLAGALLLSLLCGAATEQAGLVACAVGLEALLTALRFDRSGLKYGAGCLLSSILGLCTIFLSPGTHVRVRAETGRGLALLFSGLAERKSLAAAAVICAAAAAAVLHALLRRLPRAGRRRAAAVLIVCAGLAAAGGACFLAHRSPAALELVKRPFRAQAELCGPALLALLGALFVCLGIIYARRTGRRALSLGMTLLLLVCLVCVGLNILPAGAYCLLLLGTAVTALGFWLADPRETGVLLGLAVVSVAVMAATNSSSWRTMLPFYLFALWALIGAFQELAGEGRLTRLTAGVLLLLALVRLGTYLPPCWENWRLDRDNRLRAEQARASGELYYSVDYNLDYTHTKPFFSDYFLLSYLKSEGLSLNVCAVYFYGEGLPEVYVNGTRTRYPAAPGADGAYMLPAWYVLPLTGCECQWLDSGSTIVWDGVVYQSFRDEGQGVLSWTQAGETRTLSFPLVQGYHEVYYPLSVYREQWDLDIAESPGRIELFSRTE